MIAIGKYHIGSVLPEWWASWEELRKPTKPDGSPDWVTFTTQRQVVHHARNDIIRNTLKQFPEATHVFFVDDDVCVPPHGLLHLLSHNLPCVTGLYIQRAMPMLPVVYRRDEQGRHVNVTKFCEGLQEVDACGGGCLLVRMDVLRAIEATGDLWFDFPPSGLSEDLAFCSRVKALGYPIVLDFDVKCTHLGILEVTYDVFAEMSKDIQYANDELAHLSQEVRPWSPRVIEGDAQ
jgi:hypothetical protein